MKAKLALAVLVCATAAASAQSDDGARLRDQLRRVTLELRQAQDDQATLQAQKIAAEMERDTAKKQLASAQAELARVRRDTGRASAVEGDLARTKQALTEAAAAAQQSQAERDKIKAAADGTLGMLDACVAKNAKLVALGNEILAHYDDSDFFDSALAREPFTKLRRVELENLAQSYQDRVDDGVYDPHAVADAPKPDGK